MKQEILKGGVRALAAIILTMFCIGQADACTAPAVTSAKVANVSQDAGLSFYHLAITVTNNGASQPNNTLQSVDVMENHQKMDTVSVPPLKAGGTYTGTYTFRRSSEAGDGSTRLHLALNMSQPACTAAAPYTITF
jgi:hypothetical protein